MSYYEKYLKYKQKYIKLKNQINHIGSGKEICSICKREDIWIYKLNPIICEDCYKLQHELVKKYHELQDLAFEDIKNGKIQNGIQKLEESKKLRNIHTTTYFNDGDKGHNYFTNVFLPSLIKELNKENLTIKEALFIWSNKFSELDNSD
jgi:hypothetical protein